MNPSFDKDNENKDKNSCPFDSSNTHISKWKYAYASEIGTSHIKSQIAKQDYCLIKEEEINNSPYLFCAVSDGAGSAKYSDSSSKYICKLFIKQAIAYLKNNDITSLDRNIVFDWFKLFQQVILRTAKIMHIDSPREFAATLLFSVLSEKGNIFVQIGDGLIAKGDKENLDCVFLPQNGEYLNTTFFATDKNIFEQFMFKFDTSMTERLIMHTDGIELIAFDFKNKKPHFNFFNPIFAMLEDSNSIGYNKEISDFISEFLSCERVNQRTDDDKTLAVISLVGKNTNEIISKESKD